jgi:hypothetical protein
MLKKIILGAILVTVIGAGGTALAYGVTTQDTEAAADIPAPLANEQTADNAPVGGQAAQNGAAEPAVAAQEMMGEPWQADGTIAKIDDYGFQYALQNGETVYIELGPPDYWQNQGVELQVGQAVSVDGTINDGMIHASQVMLADGQMLQVRDENGQPLWSGGASNAQGQNGVQDGTGDHTPNPQAQVDEWVTISGTLMSFQGGNMTMSTTDGEIITFKTGQPRFFADQGITFNTGDEIVVVGFYEGAEFMAGDITQVSTGLRVMLRDPNGRPLWAGPGNSNGNGGNGNGNGNSGGQGGNGYGGGNR